MRNQEIYEKLKRARIPEPFENFPSQGALVGVLDLRNRVEALDGLPGFDTELDVIRKSIVFRTSQTQVHIPANEWNELAQLFRQFYGNLVGVHDFLKASLASQSAESVYIKLPETKNITEITSYLNRIDKAIGQVVHNEAINGKVELGGWERGSLWIEVAVGSVLAVKVIGVAAWSGAVVWKKVQEAKLHAEYAKGLSLRNGFLEEILDAAQNHIKATVDAEAKALADANLKGPERQEVLERAKFTIREFAEMMEKGAEIHPGLQAPEQVRNLFPDTKNILSLQSRIPQITEKVEDNKGA